MIKIIKEFHQLSNIHRVYLFPYINIIGTELAVIYIVIYIYRIVDKPRVKLNTTVYTLCLTIDSNRSIIVLTHIAPDIRLYFFLTFNKYLKDTFSFISIKIFNIIFAIKPFSID